MMWQALITDDDGGIRQVLREIVAASDAGPAADLAVLRSYLAADETVPDPDDVATRELERAVGELASAPHAGLHGGAARIAWVVAHLAGNETADAVCGGFDQAILATLADWRGDFDLIAGVVGLGVYALERKHADLASAIIAHLEQRALPRHGGRAWHSGPELLSPSELASAPDGYWNLGLAHGAPGGLAILARFAAADIERARCLALARDVFAYLVAAAPARPPGAGAGRYPSWEGLAVSSRLAWCYGDLGVAVALVGAGLHAGKPAWRDEGLALARDCAARTLEQAAVHEIGICHGAAGIAHMFHRLARATGDATVAAAARTWLARTVSMCRKKGQPTPTEDRGSVGAGAPREQNDPRDDIAPSVNGTTGGKDDVTQLTGATGVALVLHAAISDVEPSWDRVLLSDLP